MKVLTIKNPWATLVISGYKKYEFRSWKTNYRGKILIHAGKSINSSLIKEFTKYQLDYINGAIIGEAELTDCILIDEKINQTLKQTDPLLYGRNSHIDEYAWKLENIKKYDKPIFINGKLGLWNYEGEVEK